MNIISDKEYQVRVIIEKYELDAKIVKLIAFYDTEIYRMLDEEEAIRLSKQQGFMEGYSKVLGERIAAFKR